MADRPEMFGPTRGFSVMADSMEPCCVAFATLTNQRAPAAPCNFTIPDECSPLRPVACKSVGIRK